MADSFGSQSAVCIDDHTYAIHRLDAVYKH